MRSPADIVKRPLLTEKGTTLKEKGQVKVRLAKTADRAALDKTAEKLRKAGFKPFAVKAE